MVDKKYILSEIQRLADRNGGKPLGRERFAKETGIREGDWLGRYWARWSDACSEAGLKPNQLQSRHDDEDALGQLALETRRLGHLPTYAELKMRRRSDSNFPSPGVFERLGPKRALARRLAEYCGERGDLSDVVQLLSPLLEFDDSDDDRSDTDQSKDGFVYLLKSGRHYKIGRTNSFGRREYEIGLQLPDPATKIHVIRTDDPAGIEQYWHVRFAERRKNGEWFELSKADVRAFKRRSFM
jgi:hypothetical protein